MGEWNRKTGQIKRIQGKSPLAEGKSASRFRTFLEKIAVLREKERDIISEINDVEEKHRFLRKHKKLKRPTAEQKSNNNNGIQGDSDYENERDQGSWLWWALLWMIALSKRPRLTKRRNENLDVG